MDTRHQDLAPHRNPAAAPSLYAAVPVQLPLGWAGWLAGWLLTQAPILWNLVLIHSGYRPTAEAGSYRYNTRKS